MLPIVCDYIARFYDFGLCSRVPPVVLVVEQSMKNLRSKLRLHNELNYLPTDQGYNIIANECRCRESESFLRTKRTSTKSFQEIDVAD
ncbi:hypothetical protein TcasGA2_TC008771 [Tribolium castaneum]|uniref:Uncharacterized protein n=1 Tax=Tribolium castaneum TaxID=7070 RepID=D6WRS9_TRICA|nr:hypothetical protein TcasGA2_TC008771 [Tribolium castaneum]